MTYRLLCLLLLASGCAVQDLGSVDAGVDNGSEDAAVFLEDAGGIDSAMGDGFPVDSGVVDSGFVDAGPPPPPVPEDVFFVGNSFTAGGPIPVMVHDLAVYAGFAEPNVSFRTVGGRSLGWHREDTGGNAAPNQVLEGWDIVVLQDLSTRPTDALGDPEGFKQDATWFHDLALEANPECRVVLFETWARHEDHGLYPTRFADPMEMQAQLRTHYFDAAESYIPLNSAFEPNVVVAPVGDAWEYTLMGADAPRLHASDDYHAGSAGQYLNALVIYSTIYGRHAEGLIPLLGLTDAAASQLQESADAITGETRPPPILEPPLEITIGDSVRIDFGEMVVDGWPAIISTMGSAGPLDSDAGSPTSVRAMAFGFDGIQNGGRSDNTLGWPEDVSADSLWIGSFDGHAEALSRSAMVVVRGIPAGEYDVEVFASRTGADSGRGRLVRFAIGAAQQDLEVANNTSDTALFAGISPNESGELQMTVGVSPDGGARFAYLGAVVITRVR